MKLCNLKYLFLSCGLVLTAILPAVETTAFKVGGYYENWSQYRNRPVVNNKPTYPLGTFPACSPSNLSLFAKNLDELYYAFALFNYNTQPAAGSTTPQGVTGDFKIYFSEWDDYNTNQPASSLIVKAAGLRAQNPDLKIMLSIGGWNFNDSNPADSTYGPSTFTFFADLLNSSTNQTNFIDSLLVSTPTRTATLLLKDPDGNYIFDGIDLDYEYPGEQGTGTANRGGQPTDYDGYLTFIKELRSRFEASGRTLYISMTIPPFLPNNIVAGSWTAGTYPTTPTPPFATYGAGTISPTDPSTYFAWMSIVANHCDWVNLMAYDMYGFGFSDGKVKYQAPLYNNADGSAKRPSGNYDPNTVTNLYSIDYAVWMWTVGATMTTSTITGTGIPASKINLGLPAYGRTYGFDSAQSTTANPVAYGTNSGLSVTKAGPATTQLEQGGVIAYFELYPLVASSGYSGLVTTPPFALARNTAAAQSYATINCIKPNPPNATPLEPNASPLNMVVCFDSTFDFAAKTAYATNQKLRGVFVYALSEDNLLNGSATNSLFEKGIVNTLNSLQGVQTTFQPNIDSR